MGHSEAAVVQASETRVAPDKAAVRRVLDAVKAQGRTSLTAPEGKEVCDAYGIAVPREGVATSAAEASKLASGMGFPVVLKIVSPDILHKTEAGGVLVGVKSAEGVAQGYETIVANAKKYNVKAQILGVQVQQMLGGGQEVIVGAVTDPSFGKLVAFGLGGVLVEVLKDITFRLAPASHDEALSMLDSTSTSLIPSIDIVTNTVELLTSLRIYEGNARGVPTACFKPVKVAESILRNVSQAILDVYAIYPHL